MIWSSSSLFHKYKHIPRQLILNSSSRSLDDTKKRLPLALLQIFDKILPAGSQNRSFQFLLDKEDYFRPKMRDEICSSPLILSNTKTSIIGTCLAQSLIPLNQVILKALIWRVIGGYLKYLEGHRFQEL